MKHTRIIYSAPRLLLLLLLHSVLSTQRCEGKWWSRERKEQGFNACVGCCKERLRACWQCGLSFSLQYCRCQTTHLNLFLERTRDIQYYTVRIIIPVTAVFYVREVSL